MTTIFLGWTMLIGREGRALELLISFSGRSEHHVFVRLYARGIMVGHKIYIWVIACGQW